MCGIVATAIHAPSHSPRSPSFPPGSTQPEVLWRDDNFTIYRERANPVSSKGHIIIVFKYATSSPSPPPILIFHPLVYMFPPYTCSYVPSIPLYSHSTRTTYRSYSQSSSDLPLLVAIRDLSRRLLSSLLPASSPSSPNLLPTNTQTPTTATTPQQLLNHPHLSPHKLQQDEFRIGFITPPFKDSKIPVTDHLHAHAYILPADLMGWWRSVSFSPLAWYAIDDLIAEIRYAVLSIFITLPPHHPILPSLTHNLFLSSPWIPSGPALSFPITSPISSLSSHSVLTLTPIYQGGNVK